MNNRAQADFLIGQMRVVTMGEITYFYVGNQPTEFKNLDRDLDILLDKLEQAKKMAGLAAVGPDVVRYFPAGSHAPGLYWMEVGIPVSAGTSPVGEARVKTLPPYHCAGMLLWGGLMHMGQTHVTLERAVAEAGLQKTGEYREWNYWFESVDSPNNLIGLYLGIQA